MSMVRLESVRKTYGKHVAVDGVSFAVAAGEVVALLGANGAGKTTSLEILLGLRHADSGRVEMNARTVGVTPQETGMPQNIRVSEIVEFVSHHYPNPANGPAILKAFDLQELAHRQTGGLSGGQLRRLALALAFVGQPELVVLDEPTTGLDIESRRNVWAFVRAYAEGGGTVLLTTHHMEEAEALATRILVMSAGAIVRDGTPAQIRRTVSSRRLIYTGHPFDPSTFGIDATVEQDDSRVIITAADTDALLRAMVHNDIQFTDLSVTGASLEDAVLSLTGASK